MTTDDLKQQTIDTYNKSAQNLAEYFQGIGSRIKDIEKAFSLAGHPKDARVIELGCGDGRDAEEIVKRAQWFQGMDISEGMLRIAQEKLPEHTFIQDDVATYRFPEKLDIVFAFASLLHSPKEEVETVLKNAHAALHKGGIFFISLKHMPEYATQIKEDAHGKRLFYFYHPELITQLAGDMYENVFQDFQTIGKTKWFTIALKKA